MKIFLIRHGETEANSEGTLQGQGDSPLSERGIKQAMMLAKVLKNENIKAIYCSDLGRAHKTAEIINKEIPRAKCIAMKELRELNVGELEGQKWSYVQNLSREEFNRIMKQHNGESLNQFQQRVWRGFLEIISKHNNNDKIIVITHGGCIRQIIQKILNSKDVFDKLRIDNGSITRIHIEKEKNKLRFQLEQLNDISHINRLSLVNSKTQR